MVSMPPRRSCFGAAVQRPCLRCGVSMPPRRSCFTWTAIRSNPKMHVSMPPRRSCFALHHPGARLPKGGFNATTAFLLRRRGPPPGTRSCPFQCHHGVPASPKLLEFREEVINVSMPPRRSCFCPDHLTSDSPETPVSMPPRRSCFGLFGSGRPAGHRGFNATTAFLLLITVSFCFGWGCLVSMPPRRSCFSEAKNQIEAMIASFNATTAFLLPDPPSSRSSPSPLFQCHHGVPASRTRGDRREWVHGFQCHHGVPASPSPFGILDHVSQFQCHHGVPASIEKVANAFAEIRVSMPPRRSCFVRVILFITSEEIRFNATTAFLLHG